MDRRGKYKSWMGTFSEEDFIAVAESMYRSSDETLVTLKMWWVDGVAPDNIDRRHMNNRNKRFYDAAVRLGYQLEN